MVQEIKKAFRAKYSKINLSNERLEAYATKWASKIENEDAIEEFLKELDVEPLEEIARLDDALRAKSKQTEEPKVEEPGEPKDDLAELKEQIAELRNALTDKQKSDLKDSRSKEFENLPEALKVSLKFVDLASLSDDDFNALKTDLNTQAEALKVDSSKTNPRFGGGKTPTTISEEEAKKIASRI